MDRNNPNDSVTKKNSKSGPTGGKSAETMFRVTLRNQVDHIAIADSKANMIININTIIISLVVALLGSGLGLGGITFLEQTMLVIPLTVFMITCLVSAIYAVLSTRPKLNKPQNDGVPSSLLFFGKIAKLDYQTYIKEMNEMMNSRESIYTNLTTDIYHQGKILARKYRLVQYAYSIFILGLSACVILFLILWLFPNGN